MRSSPLRWLLIVGLAYAAFQLSAFALDRAPSWDEAIYLSQVAPGADAYHFTASRARGITFLVAPLAAGSLPVIRVGLALLASAALVGAFAPWIRTVDLAAPAGAAFLVSTWTALFYGSEVMPNLWVGLAGLAALGFATRDPAGRRTRRDDVAAATLLAAAALVRPFDAVLLAGPVVVGALLVGRRSVRTAGLLALGVGAGCLPWLVEMGIRYGSVGAALAQAVAVAHVSVPDPWSRIAQYLATADGPTIGPVIHSGVSGSGLIAMVAPAAASAVAVFDARREGRPGPLVASLGAGALAAVAYVGFVAGVAPRFLIPATALVSIPVGRGLVVLWRRSGPAALRATLVLVLAAWAVWQASVAVRLESSAARQRGGVQAIGLRIRSLAGGRACVVASVVGAPQVGYAAGCRGRPIVDPGSVDLVLDEEADRGVKRVFVVVAGPPGPAPPGTSGRWSMSEPGTGPITISRVDLERSTLIRPRALS
jgi:hypothetical protein